MLKNSTTYSEQEKKVGTFLGKPLYQRTIVVNKTIKDIVPTLAANANIAVNDYVILENCGYVDELFVVEDMCKICNAGQNGNAGTGLSWKHPYGNNSYAITLYKKDNNIDMEIRANNGMYLDIFDFKYFTIRYTKTTE